MSYEPTTCIVTCALLDNIPLHESWFAADAALAFHRALLDTVLYLNPPRFHCPTACKDSFRKSHQTNGDCEPGVR